MTLIDLVDKVPEDKQKHVAVGLLIGLAFGQSVTLALVVLLIVSLGKELYDLLYNMFVSDVHEVSLYDSVATIAGGVIGIGVVSVIGLIIGGIV